MFHKAELCFIKARAIYSGKLDPHHRAVGDCIFSMGILYMRNSKFSKSLILFREALACYQ